MRFKEILREVLPLILVIPLVMLIFKVIPDRTWAATVAGLFFAGVPLVLMGARLRTGPSRARGAAVLWWFGILQFWLAFALPILGARLLNWEKPFEDFIFFGRFSGPEWHELSSRSYVAMIAFVVVAALWPRRAPFSEKQKASI